MDVYVLNKSFKPVVVIDTFKSLIWTKRYYTYGDFELYIPADESLLAYLQPDYFLARDDDDSVMVIEKLEAQTDIENGDFFIVSGRSLESILTRRVIATQTTINTQSPILGIQQLMFDQCLNSDNQYRYISNLSVDTESLTIPETFRAQYTGNILLTAITEICMRYGFGMKMILSDSNMVLSFYQGKQVDVIFSQEFDNLINSDYVFDYTKYANFAQVAGEGEGTSRRTVGVTMQGTMESGLRLREIYVDARDISSDAGAISDSEYNAMLTERGKENLASEHSVTETFEAEIEPERPFAYKIDYNLGDIVTVTNEYGVTANPRIVEIIESWDETGYKAVPAFDALEVQ